MHTCSELSIARLGDPLGVVNIKCLLVEWECMGFGNIENLPGLGSIHLGMKLSPKNS